MSATTSSARRGLATVAVCVLVAVPSYGLAALLTVWAPGLVGGAQLLTGAACLAALPAGMIALVGQPLVRGARAEHYVRRAVASGLGPGRVRWLHALRPTIAPMISLAAAEVGALLAATVLVEPVLGRPGVGSLLVWAMDVRQGPVLLAIVGTFVIAVAVANLLADLTLTLVDPRARHL